MFTRRDLYTALSIVIVTAVILVGVKLLQTTQFTLPQAANVTYTYYPWGTKRNNSTIPSGPTAVFQMNSSLSAEDTTTYINGPDGTFWEWKNNDYVRDARWQLSAFNGIWKPGDQVKTPSAWGGNQPNNLYPWTDNGPTAAYRNPFTNTFHVCNQGWCWIFDRTTRTWGYEGKPIDLEYEWKTKPGTPLVHPGEINGQTVYPWTEINGVAGPTSANYSPETNTIAICNVILCWYQNGPTTFANNGDAYDIRTSNAFEGSVKPWDYDGNGQEDNPLIGLTAGWSDATGKSHLCTYDKCWSYNSELRKYQPYTLSSTNPAGGATVQPFTQQTTVADPTSTPTQSPPCVPSIAAPSNNSTIQYPFDLKINNTCQSPKYQLDIKNNQTNQSSTLHINQPVSKPAQITIPATNILIDEPDNPSGSFTFKIKSCTSTQESSCTGNWSPTVTFTIQAANSDPCVLSSLTGELISNATGIKVDSNPSGGCDNVDYVFKITNPDESNSYINNRVGYINKYNVDDGMYVVKAKLCDYGTGTSNSCKYAGQEVYTQPFYYWVANGLVSLEDLTCWLTQETPADGASITLPADFSWNRCPNSNRWDLTFYNLNSSGQADTSSIAKKYTNLTDNQASVTASDLDPGTYVWQVTTDEGWTSSSRRNVTIESGPNGTISGKVWRDRNNNGQFDNPTSTSTEGLSRVELRLMCGDTEVATTETDGSGGAQASLRGTYSFTGLDICETGAYTVEIVSIFGIENDLNIGDTEQEVTLTADAMVVNNIDLEVKEELVTLTGYTYYDRNGNDQLDTGEEVPDINMQYQCGSSYRAQYTNESGQFMFEELPCRPGNSGPITNDDLKVFLANSIPGYSYEQDDRYWTIAGAQPGSQHTHNFKITPTNQQPDETPTPDYANFTINGATDKIVFTTAENMVLVGSFGADDPSTIIDGNIRFNIIDPQTGEVIHTALADTADVIIDNVDDEVVTVTPAQYGTGQGTALTAITPGYYWASADFEDDAGTVVFTSDQLEFTLVDKNEPQANLKLYDVATSSATIQVGQPTDILAFFDNLALQFENRSNLSPTDYPSGEFTIDLFINQPVLPPVDAIPDASTIYPSLDLTNDASSGQSYTFEDVIFTQEENLVCVWLNRGRTIEEAAYNDNRHCIIVNAIPGPDQPPVYSTDLRDYLVDYTIQPTTQPVNFIRMIREHLLTWLPE